MKYKLNGKRLNLLIVTKVIKMFNNIVYMSILRYQKKEGLIIWLQY